MVPIRFFFSKYDVFFILLLREPNAVHFSSVEKLIIEKSCDFSRARTNGKRRLADIHFSSADVYFIQLLVPVCF